jgi:hypothetical protein
VKLAAESQRRHLEATLANAKRDAAQATSAHKLAAATWQAECSTHEKEVGADCTQHDGTATSQIDVSSAQAGCFHGGVGLVADMFIMRCAGAAHPRRGAAG